MRRALGAVLIVAGIAIAVIVVYLLIISSGMPHGRTIGGAREWSYLVTSVLAVAMLLYAGYRLWSGPGD